MNDVVAAINASVVASSVDGAILVVSVVGVTSDGVDFVLAADVVVVAAAFVASPIAADALDANVDEHRVDANGDVDVDVVDVDDIIIIVVVVVFVFVVVLVWVVVVVLVLMVVLLLKLLLLLLLLLSMVLLPLLLLMMLQRVLLV